MTPPAEPDDASRRALAEVERLRAANTHLAGLLSATQRFDRDGVWEQAQLQLALALSGIGLWQHDLRSGLLHQDERAHRRCDRGTAGDGARHHPPR